MIPAGRFPNFSRWSLAGLRTHYAAGGSAEDVIDEVLRRIAARGEDAVWIHLGTREEMLRGLPEDRSLPLYGVPFAVKDNMDVAGWPTTAGCPAYARKAERDAAVVARLRAAGAIPVGKTNLDQFATGLNGTRSPYGIPRCVFDDRYISGGSSSGSAVAVASGEVAFSLGTDTAGSGRVPASFNALVGLKPTRGWLSNDGVVPACRSLDCVSVFADAVADAFAVAEVAGGKLTPPPAAKGRVFGTPPREAMRWCGDTESERIFWEAVERMKSLGWTHSVISPEPFLRAAELLYAGPWVAERTAAVGAFLDAHPGAAHPVVEAIIAGGKKYSAVEVFEAMYRLEEFKALAEAEWAKMDALLLPTAPTVFTVEEMLAEPVKRNSDLGTYTNFVNLLDLCAIAIPAGVRDGGVPLGVTLMARAGEDAWLAGVCAEFTGEAWRPPATGEILLAVAGAHMRGFSLNGELLAAGGRFVQTTRTAPDYRLFALAGTVPLKPGLVREHGFAGPGIELEIWTLPEAGFGRFVSVVPAPMAIGTVTLADGRAVKGFLCEPGALTGATDVTRFGGWRAYLNCG